MMKHKVFVILMMCMVVDASRQLQGPGEEPSPADPEDQNEKSKFVKEYDVCLDECIKKCDKDGQHYTDCEVACDEDCTQMTDDDKVKLMERKSKKKEQEQGKKEGPTPGPTPGPASMVRRKRK